MRYHIACLVLLLADLDPDPDPEFSKSDRHSPFLLLSSRQRSPHPTPLPATTQHKRGEIQSHPHATFSSLLLQVLLLLFLSQPSTREERSNPTPTQPSLHFCCRFFCLLFGFACGSKWASASPTGLLLQCACVSKICCCCAPASPRSAVLPRACISNVCCAGSCLILLLLLFLRSYMCSKSAANSQPQFFFSDREDHGEAYDLPVFWQGLKNFIEIH
jgi:hypothetical protein